jgi:hypothetical protein
MWGGKLLRFMVALGVRFCVVNCLQVECGLAQVLRRLVLRLGGTVFGELVLRRTVVLLLIL